MKTSVIVIAAVAAFSLSAVASAEGMKRKAKAGNFSHQATHTLGNGKTFTRSTQQVVENGVLNRSTTLTNAQGQVASRNVTITPDKAAGEVTKVIQKTNFKGETSERSVTRSLPERDNVRTEPVPAPAAQ